MQAASWHVSREYETRLLAGETCKTMHYEVKIDRPGPQKPVLMVFIFAHASHAAPTRPYGRADGVPQGELYFGPQSAHYISCSL